MGNTLQGIQEALLAARGDWQGEDYSKQVEVTESSVCVVSDVHVPYHSEELTIFSIMVAKERGCSAYVILGDLFDMHLFSSFGVTDKNTKFTRELAMGAEIIRQAAGEVGKVYWSSGNHEDRWMRKNDYHVGMAQLAAMAGLSDLIEQGLLITSDNPTLAGQHNWMFTHPATYGSTPLLVPGKLATQYERNVMSAHAHHFGMGTDSTGKWLVVETGGLFEPRLVQYKQWRVTTHRNWVKGFWLLMEGQPVPFLVGA